VLTSPLLLHNDDLLTIKGDGASVNEGTCIRANFVGPMFHVRGTTAWSDYTLTTALATGSGQALSSDPAIEAPWVDFVDAAASGFVNGLSQLTVRFFFKYSAATGNDQHMVFSEGRLTPLASGTAAVRMKIDGTGHLVGCINVAGTCTTMTSAAVLTTNTVYYVELSYNGSAVKLFYGIPGATTTQAGSTVTTSGSVSQALFENWPLTGQRTIWPHGPSNNGVLKGVLDSIEVSNTARHTATFTAPTAKHAADGNTLLLENFDNESADFSVITTSNGTAYLPKYSETGGSQARALRLSGIRFDVNLGSAAVFANGMIQSTFHDLVMRVACGG
jgi:hypothetical protein